MPRGIEAILRKVPAGFDEFVTEKYQDHVAAFLRDWNSQLLQSPQNTAALEKIISTDFFGESPKASVWRPVYEGPTIQVWKGQFASDGNFATK